MQGSFYDGDDRNRYRGYQSATRVGDRTYSPYGPNVASPLDPPPAPERRPLAGLDSIDSMEIDSEEIDAMPDPPPQEAPTPVRGPRVLKKLVLITLGFITNKNCINKRRILILR